MTKRIFLFLIIAALFSACNTDSSYQTTSSGIASIDVPWTWKVTTEENGSLTTISAQSLKGAGPEVVVLNIFDDQLIDEEEMIESYENNLKQEMKTSRTIEFGDIKTSEFKGMPSLECEYRGKEANFKYSGKVMVFNDGKNSFFIMIQGGESFVESKKAKKIVDSFKIANRQTETLPPNMQLPNEDQFETADLPDSAD